MLGWEAPAALWLGLAVPAIVLLYFLRPRPPRRRVPSLLLWPPAAGERQSAAPWQRLRSHPLLWLQVLVAAALAVAAARPFRPAAAGAQHLVVILDASGSMRAQDVPGGRYHAAQEQVRRLARGLGPGQRLTLIRMGAAPAVRVEGATGPAAVEAALAGDQPDYGPADVAGALALAAVVSGGRPATWVLVSDGALAIPPDFRLPPGAAFRFVPVGERGDNVAIAGLSLREGRGVAAAQVAVRNQGAAPASGRLLLLAEGRLLAAREFHLGPREEAFLPFDSLPPGTAAVEARLTGLDPARNVLAEDDQAFAAAPLAAGPAAGPAGPAAQPQVLLVSPGNPFLERFLAAYGQVRAFRAPPGAAPALAGRYPLVIYDGVWPDPWPRGSALVIGPPGDAYRPGALRPAPGHPLLRHVDLSDVEVARARRLPLGPGWEAVVDGDGGPLLAVWAGGAAAGAQPGGPAPQPAAGQRAAVLAFALGDSTLPLRPAFPVLMANLMEWLLPAPAAVPEGLRAGVAAPLPVPPLAEAAWVEGPGGWRQDLAPPWPPAPFRPPAPGLYRLVWRTGDQVQAAPLAVAGADPAEPLAPSPVRLPVAEDASRSPAGAAALWPWLAAAALALALAEWWVDARGR